MLTYHVFEDHVEYHNEDGKLHRLDGPAVEWNDGGKEWWINGVPYIEDEFNKKINKPDILKEELKTIINNLNSLIEKL